jgi:DNA polymerase-3 subunit gamma/tau
MTAYVVLARKYRPQIFDELVGQDHVTRTLKNAILRERIHHAYLFCGSRGVGKTTAARILAKALNCEKGPTPTPCDACDSCVEIREGQAVDVLEVDGASHTGVDDVRELRETVRYLPVRGRKKVLIIDEVHMLSQSAFNALLKTLEEPPAHVVFILATTDPHRIPQTILSRCQRFDFRRLPDALLVEHMDSVLAREGLSADRAALATIARAADGSVRDSLSLLDQVLAFAAGGAIDEKLAADVLGVADRRSLLALGEAVISRDPAGALARVEEIYRSGADLGRFAMNFHAHLRDLVVASVVAQPDALLEMGDDDRRRVREQAGRAERPVLQAMFERFGRAVDDIARSQTPRLALEAAVLDLVEAEPMVPLGDLFDRLAALEARIERGGGPEVSRSTAPPRTAAPARGAVAPARAAPAPVAPGPPDWTAWVARLQKDEPRLGAVFALGRPVRITASEAVIGFAPESFELDQARGLKGELERFLSRAVGRAIAVKVEPIAASTPAGPSVAEQDDGKRAAERERRRGAAVEHPAVRAAVEVLGAQIREVKADAD